jgi:Flp pilus assembly protein TadG
MPRSTKVYRRFVASTRAVAAVEFGLVLPILLLMLLASIDAGRAIAIYMKVRASAYTVDAVTNQYSVIHDTDMQQILGASAVVLSPYSPTPLKIIVSQLSISAGGQATATWSDALNATARPVGSSVVVPSTLTGNTPPNNICASFPCYVILGEVSYSYTPMFGYFITGPITLADTVYVTPRSVNSVTRTSP